jgi:hypothetical protein
VAYIIMSFFTEIKVLDEQGDLINSDNPFPVETPAFVSTANSTSTLLAADGIFTGTSEAINGYGIIYINAYSDVASATDGLEVQQSSDGTNWDHCDEFTIPAAQGKNFSINPYARYFRIRYINGPAPQAIFRLQTIFKVNGKSSSHRIADSIVSDDDAELTKAVLTGEAPSGTFYNAKVTEEGRLDVSSISEKIQIARGLIPGFEFIEKFGRNADIDIADAGQQIWSGGPSYGNWVAPTAPRIHNIVSTDANDTSGGTGARSLFIQGLDASWNPQSETVVMNGTTPVPTVGSYSIIHRMKVNSCGTAKSNIGVITATAQTDGTVTAEIPAGKGKTLMAIYGVRAGYSLYLEQIYSSLNASGSAAAWPGCILELRVIENADTSNSCEFVEHVWGLASRGNSSVSHEFKVSKVIAEKSIVFIDAESVTDDNSDISAGFDGYLIQD